MRLYDFVQVLRRVSDREHMELVIAYNLAAGQEAIPADKTERTMVKKMGNMLRCTLPGALEDCCSDEVTHESSFLSSSDVRQNVVGRITLWLDDAARQLSPGWTLSTIALEEVSYYYV